jgi:tetratricopeptide (TPR) repeat protein
MTLAGNAYVKLGAARIREAMADADDALGLADDLLSECFGVIFLAESYLESAQPEAAWSLLEAHAMTGSTPELWPFPWLRSTPGWLRFLRGDTPGALVDLHAAGVLMLRFDFRTPAALPWRARIAAVWAACGERDRAQRLAQRDLRNARRWGERRTIAAALSVAGSYAEGEDAIRLLEEALQLATGPQEVVPRIDALTTLGALLRRQGHRRHARELLGEAQTLAHETGALAALRRARDELLAAGGRPRRDAWRGRRRSPSPRRVGWTPAVALAASRRVAWTPSLPPRRGSRALPPRAGPTLRSPSSCSSPAAPSRLT